MNMNHDADMISPDPMDRVPEELKPILADPRVFFDVHCHVFNYEDVPNGFVGMRIPMKKRFLAFLIKILKKINGRLDVDKYRRIANFLDILRKSSSEEIAIDLIDYYPRRKAILTPLTMDLEVGIKGKINRPFWSQIEEMKILRDKLPNKILPFICIDPNRPEAIENFQKVFTSDQDYSFFGVKVYPSLGYLPSHPILMKVFSICEEKNIPVTAHCGHARVRNSKFYLKNIKGLRKKGEEGWEAFRESRFLFGKSDYSKYFNEPGNWEPVLAAYPNLKLNLAHFGGVAEWAKFCKGDHNNRVSSILEMMGRYDHLYADFSYTCYDRRYNLKLKQLIQDNQLVAERILFGSDFYMVVVEGNYRHILADFIATMGDKIMQQIGVNNPKRFLFERVDLDHSSQAKILFEGQAYQPFFG